VWVLWPGVNPDFFYHLSPQLIVGQHTPNRVLEYKRGPLFERVFQRLLLKPTGIPTIPHINLLLGFVIALELNFFGIYNYYMIPRIDVGSINGLVFAAQNMGNATGKSPQYLAFCIDDIPGLLKITFFRTWCHHILNRAACYSAIRSPPLLILESLSL
jgi:hypothetical protein